MPLNNKFKKRNFATKVFGGGGLFETKPTFWVGGVWKKPRPGGVILGEQNRPKKKNRDHQRQKPGRGPPPQMAKRKGGEQTNKTKIRCGGAPLKKGGGGFSKGGGGAQRVRTLVFRGGPQKSVGCFFFLYRRKAATEKKLIARGGRCGGGQTQGWGNAPGANFPQRGGGGGGPGVVKKKKKGGKRGGKKPRGKKLV